MCTWSTSWLGGRHYREYRFSLFQRRRKMWRQAGSIYKEPLSRLRDGYRDKNNANELNSYKSSSLWFNRGEGTSAGANIKHFCFFWWMKHLQTEGGAVAYYKSRTGTLHRLNDKQLIVRNTYSIVIGPCALWQYPMGRQDIEVVVIGWVFWIQTHPGLPSKWHFLGLLYWRPDQRRNKQHRN